MNTAMMVTRVSLLLVVTGLFAGMWSADSPDLRSAAEKQMARRASTPQALPDAARPLKSVVRNVSLDDSKSLPLPAGIEPGTYLVVDQSGSTQRLTIEPNVAVSSRNLVAVDQYTVRQGERRWHFIRLDAVSGREMAQPTQLVRGVGLR